jgi:F420-non-reducing hydrogenase small subunit
MTMKNKPKLALYWCAGCGGCEESVIDLAEALPAVARAAEIVFWPVALDRRYSDLYALEDNEIDAAFINGAVRMNEHVRMVRLLRQKSKTIIAHGSCAHLGGVIGLANLFTSRQLLDSAYGPSAGEADPTQWPAGDETPAPGDALPLPDLLPAVRTLGQIIAVDAIIPGCPPTPETMGHVIGDIIAGRRPQNGAVFAHDYALCRECPRKASKPDRIEITRFKRLHATRWDATVCFLPQGLICLGPVTRAGCRARCIGANMPCRGCFGPTEKMEDFGAGAISLLAAVMADKNEADLMRLIDTIADPAGLIYRYCLAASVLGQRGTP